MAIRWELKDSLKEVRKSRGLTQTELAKQIGVTQTAIAKYESGEREPSFSTIVKIEKVLNYDFVRIVFEPSPFEIDDREDMFFGNFCDDAIAYSETDDGIELIHFPKDGKRYTFEKKIVDKIYKNILKHAELEFNSLLETCRNVHEINPEEV